MMSATMDVVLALLALMSVGLLKSYRNVSERELRRRAREGDELSAALYKAVSYGSSLGVVLWLLVTGTNALFFVHIARTAPAWFAIAASAAVIWFAFVWMPARDVTRFSTWVAVKLAPLFAGLLSYLHPLLRRLVALVDRYRPITIHTGIYTKEDLVDLISSQKAQPDNRIDETALAIAQHSLNFGDILVRDVMIPRRAVKMIEASEVVGPVLMGELHESGFSRFPVYSGKKDNLIGTLYMKDLVKAKRGGKIEKVMQGDLVYIHEEQPLTDALQAILRTHRLQYIVINSFEEFVGIITLEDVIEQIVGRPIIDEFDQYDDLRAVAARAARQEHLLHAGVDKSDYTSPEAEVETMPTKEEAEQTPVLEPRQSTRH